MAPYVESAGAGAALVAAGSQARRPPPRLDEARVLFARQARNDAGGEADARQLRRVYLRLALQYHPDKCPEEDRAAATELFQAIAAAYEELLAKLDPQGGQQPGTRVKSPVAAAAELGALDELRRLLTENPERACEVDDLGVYPLMFAATGGCIEAADMLLSYGADVHAKNPIGWSALLYAALGNAAPMVRFLAGRGAAVTSHELILAAYTGNPASLEALLELYEGSVCDLRTDESKKTLLHLACEGMCFLRHTPQRHAACIELVLQRHPPVDAVEPRQRRTCLIEYVGDVRWRTRGFEHSPAHMEVVEMLCLHGASVTLEDAEGNSAISLAADMGLSRVREVLLSYA